MSIKHPKKTFMYADDTVLTFSESNVELLEAQMSKTLKSASEWFADNGLILNVKKTEMISFGNGNSAKAKFGDCSMYSGLTLGEILGSNN
jgi:hypothetical protein